MFSALQRQKTRGKLLLTGNMQLLGTAPSLVNHFQNAKLNMYYNCKKYK